jgi:PTS system fructose-specific IIC component
VRFVAITACPTGVAHTFMAAEKLQQTAEALGHQIKVETQGAIGVENALSAEDIAQADGVIIAADKDIDKARFVGKRVLVTGVADGIHKAAELIERVQAAPLYAAAGEPVAPSSAKDRGAVYKALMNGVSYMIPFVVTGGLMIAVSLSLGGKPDPAGGLVIPADSFWSSINQIGAVGFLLMVPILSGYIAYAIADRPGLAPGMIVGWIANTGTFYDSKVGAGFLGAIVTGFMVGYLVLWIKTWPVPKQVKAIMPIIVIPIVATTVVGLAFVYFLGSPIAGIFGALTGWLSGLQGGQAALLGVVLGLMIGFDMGGPVNKTAFLFGAGLIASGNLTVMGICAAAIPVPPLALGLATIVRKRLFGAEERDLGYAALFMGLFGITEGAIPFAAADPLRVIPANMIGAGVAGAIAGIGGVGDAVPHGGPIVALLGAVSQVGWFTLAVVAGVATTCLITVTLKTMAQAKPAGRPAPAEEPAKEPAFAGVAAGVAPSAFSAGDRPVPAKEPAKELAFAGVAAGVAPSAFSAGDRPVPAKKVLRLLDYVSADTISLSLDASDKRGAIDELADLLDRSGCVADRDGLVQAVLAREEQMSTGLGNELAIPHGKTDAMRQAAVAFSRQADGIDWGSLDGSAAKLFFLIAVPTSAAGNEHLEILAMLSRRLMNADWRARLQAGGSKDEILSILGEVHG